MLPGPLLNSVWTSISCLAASSSSSCCLLTDFHLLSSARRSSEVIGIIASRFVLNNVVSCALHLQVVNVEIRFVTYLKLFPDPLLNFIASIFSCSLISASSSCSLMESSRLSSSSARSEADMGTIPSMMVLKSKSASISQIVLRISKKLPTSFGSQVLC